MHISISEWSNLQSSYQTTNLFDLLISLTFRQRDNMCHVPKIKVSEAISRHSKIVLFVNDNPGIFHPTNRGFEDPGIVLGFVGWNRWSSFRCTDVQNMGPGVDSPVCFKRKRWPVGKLHRLLHWTDLWKIFFTDIISPLKNWEKRWSFRIRGSHLNLHECHWQIGRGEAVSDPSAGLNRPMECERREARSHGWYQSSFMCKDKKWHGYLVCMCALPLFLENICNKQWTHKNAAYNNKNPLKHSSNFWILWLMFGFSRLWADFFWKDSRGEAEALKFTRVLRFTRSGW